MLLLGAATAFKGDSARILLWSDLFKTSLPLGDDIDVPVLGALADNAKHNQTGRLDEHGALRHKHVELCGIGAVAIMFFAYFHIAGYPVPDFAPDFKDKDYGEYGRRDWYTYHVFSTGVGTTEMSYQAHHDRVMQMHAANDISITKVTHGTRPFAAQTARSFGASVSDTKALGGWNDSGSFKNCYDRAMPVAKDIALRQFLATLTWFRRVLIQDMAVIYTQTPHAPIFKTAPFNSTIFREFAAESTAAIHLAEEAARLAFQNLPEHLVASMRGVLATQNLGFERERHGYKMQMEAMQTQLNKVQSLLRVVAGSKRIKKAHDTFRFIKWFTFNIVVGGCYIRARTRPGRHQKSPSSHRSLGRYRPLDRSRPTGGYSWDLLESYRTILAPYNHQALSLWPMDLILIVQDFSVIVFATLTPFGITSYCYFHMVPTSYPLYIYNKLYTI
ncbi:hypothetical protein C8R46DRAFT_1188289 [Mycena filopes]|nr:hypothetical protein C8R46DRAFT_1188289 [Mycena filopes]